MIGASKILTVSYGTFSCTLEGFDEPFNTMKAIAEYFRDLAAEDRYFGAEPPTPDAAMLHKIAEREIQRRVEAKIQDNGVILRAADPDVQQNAPALAPIVVAEKPAVTSGPTLDANGESVAARLSRLRASHADLPPTAAITTVAAPIAEPAAVAAESSRYSDDDYSEDQHADELNASVLSNIAGLTAAPPAAAQDLYITDDTGFDDFTPAEEIAPAPVETQSPAAEIVASDSDAAIAAFMAEKAPHPMSDEDRVEAAFDDAFSEEDFGDETGALADLAALDGFDQPPAALPRDVSASAEMLLAETAQDDDFAEQSADVGFSDYAAEAAADSSSADAQTDALLASLSAPDLATEVTLPEPEPEAEPEAEAVFAAEPEAEKPAALSAEDALAEALGIDAPEARAVISETPEPAAPETEATTDAPPAEPSVEPTAPRARARVIKVRRIQPIAASGTATGLLSAEAEAALQAELSALEYEGADAALSAPQPVQPKVMPTRPVRPQRITTASATEQPDDLAADPAPELTPELPAELSAQMRAERDAQAAAASQAEDDALSASLQSLFAEADEPSVTPAETAQERAAPTGHAAESRRLLSELSEDESLDRLMEHTNSAMDGPEARRRTAAISHLKAAVAATEAERQAQAGNPPKPQPDRRDIYRSDLNSVVRAGSADLSGRPAGERPTPLVLVSEQRIDRIKPADPQSAISAPRMVAPARPDRATEAGQDSLLGGDMDDEDQDLTAEESAVNLFAASTSFAEFAEQLGAESLHDLLEASAVYCAQVLGRQQFSRPLVMSQLNTLPTAEDHKLEEQLRAFGTLMREGRITKVKRGAFAVTDRSPMLAEALRNAG